MKTRLFCLVQLTLLFMIFAAALPAMADQVYENGPINGTDDAWTINFGFVVSDTFTISGGTTTMTGMAFGAWLFPGDTLLSVEVSFTSDEFGGVTYFDQVVGLSASNCNMNQYGYNVCTETGTFTGGPALPDGDYWMNLQNAIVDNGDPVYWDENSGVGCHSLGCPSRPSENDLGTILSEAFTMFGSPTTTTTTTTTTSVPEPSSLMLFATGVLAIAGVLRRKLF